MKNKIYKTIFWVTLFAIAMGFMETAVVVYLREMYYPNGFSFPLKIIDYNIAITEFFREIATLIMLIAIGIIAGRKNTERFAFFIYAFAIWDIFYYIFLKVILNWPESLLTWDILFMVPVTWVGPVIAPVINSLTMILLAFIIIHFTEKNGDAKINKYEWMLLITGSLVIIFSYTQEYMSYMLNKFSFAEMLGISGKQEVINYACNFIPKYFNWYIFCLGELMNLSAIYLFAKNNKKIPVG
ncbi:MAG TPA: hypothetical protein PKK00_01335 [Bacteroidales bacterium]|nr:hypothetical protein [Bacteroidales bacterium]HPS16040.1 hypothetical protein [Bacteroidales bacterium]